MRCPGAWTILAEELWRLPVHQSKAFWCALAEAQWTRPVALRQSLALVGHMRVDLDHLCWQVLAPATEVAVIEDLVRERLLRRAQANHITESLLQQVDQHGCYKGERWDGMVRVRGGAAAPAGERGAGVPVALPAF